MRPRILVAGIGNIFLGDDGFGPEVIRCAGARIEDAGATAVDYGVGGMHLTYDLLDDWDALILVDALPDRGAPGEVRTFEADSTTSTGAVDRDTPWAAGPETGSGAAGLDAHRMDPGAVFAGLRVLGGTPPRTIVVGCQVRDVGEGIGLSDPVAAAVPTAVAAVRSAVTMLRAEAGLTRREG